MKKNLPPILLLSGVLAGMVLLAAIILPMRRAAVAEMVAAQATATAAAATVQVAEPAPVRAPAVVEFTLRTHVGGDPAMSFVGVGGDIDGVVNPELVVNVGDTVRLTVINGGAVLHDLVIDELGVHSDHLDQDGQTAVLEFTASQPGDFVYYCSIPGHREIGMKGLLRVVGEPRVADELTASATHPRADHQPVAQSLRPTTARPAAADAVSIVRHPADLPPPIGPRAPEHHVVELTTVEVNGVLADGTTYRYMTFNGAVPGPFLRLRVGDSMEVHLHNDASSQLPHSIDLHAVTGPGGGAVWTQTMPGESTSFRFRALQPGLYVYHCATPSIGHHIASGMYGLILVEPEAGLPPVEREFYVMQGELYTVQPINTQGHVDFSYARMLDEQADYFVFNGAAGGLTTDEYALRAQVGETVRIYFGVGGPNFISSFHVIGEIFDRVYEQASLTAAPLTDVQTTLVPPGGATMVEFTLDVPGRYILVDHALSRAERGLMAFLYAEGDENPDIFHGEGEANHAGH